MRRHPSSSSSPPPSPKIPPRPLGAFLVLQSHLNTHQRSSSACPSPSLGSPQSDSIQVRNSLSCDSQYSTRLEQSPAGSFVITIFEAHFLTSSSLVCWRQPHACSGRRRDASAFLPLTTSTYLPSIVPIPSPSPPPRSTRLVLLLPSVPCDAPATLWAGLSTYRMSSDNLLAEAEANNRRLQGQRRRGHRGRYGRRSWLARGLTRLTCTLAGRAVGDGDGADLGTRHSRLSGDNWPGEWCSPRPAFLVRVRHL